MIRMGVCVALAGDWIKLCACWQRYEQGDKTWCWKRSFLLLSSGQIMQCHPFRVCLKHLFCAAVPLYFSATVCWYHCRCADSISKDCLHFYCHLVKLFFVLGYSCCFPFKLDIMITFDYIWFWMNYHTKTITTRDAFYNSIILISFILHNPVV